MSEISDLRPSFRQRFSLGVVFAAPVLGIAGLIGLAQSQDAIAQDQPPMAADLPGLLAYNRQSDDLYQWDLFVSAGDGTLERQLLNTADKNIRGEEQVRWSPDGQELAYTTFDKDGEAATIWRLPYAGGEPQRVSDADVPDAGYPAWRPDGGAILFTGKHEGAGPSALDLHIVDEAGDRSFFSTTDREERSPDWSADGDQVVFESLAVNAAMDDNWWDIYIAEADGSNPRPLVARLFSTERFPRFSPDGRQVAYVSFASREGYGRGSLRLLDIDSGLDRELLRAVGLQIAWSPDGAWILVYNTADEGLGRPGEATAIPPKPSEPQRLGLYVYRMADGAIFRLQGAAGGADAGSRSFKWGQIADWTGGTYTPTPDASPTPTASPTATTTLTPTASRTPSQSVTPTRTASPSPPSPTAISSALPEIYLPFLLRSANLP